MRCCHLGENENQMPRISTRDSMERLRANKRRESDSTGATGSLRVTLRREIVEVAIARVGWIEREAIA